MSSAELGRRRIVSQSIAFNSTVNDLMVSILIRIRLPGYCRRPKPIHPGSIRHYGVACWCWVLVRGCGVRDLRVWVAGGSPIIRSPAHVPRRPASGASMNRRSVRRDRGASGGSAFDDAAVFEDVDDVGLRGGGEAVGDDDGRAADGGLTEAIEPVGLRLRVHRAGLLNWIDWC